MEIENCEFDELFMRYKELIMEANDLLIRMQLIKIDEIQEVLENGVLPST